MKTESTWRPLTMSCIIILLLLTVVSGSYSEKDYDYDAENSDVLEDKAADDNETSKGSELELISTPKFVTAPQSIIENEGGTVRLPCIVERLEGFVLLWKKNTDIVTVASQIIDKRVRLTEEDNGNHLILSQATPEDSGEYTCQISAYKPTEITHKLLIRVEPVITTLPEDELIVNEGSQASLECSVVSGTPTPEVRWVKKDGEMEAIIGTTLSFSGISRKDAGTYLCMADNGFSSIPVQKEVKIIVNYAPEIQVEETYIVTNMGEEQEIVCIVDSSPEAEVAWMKDGESLDATSHDIVLSHKDSRHSLLIVSVSEKSVGEYSCKANNSLGAATATADISGDAHPADILSNHISDHPHMFTLEWSAHSKSNIELFEVKVRRQGDEEWKIYEVKVENNETSTNDTEVIDNDYRADLILTNLEAETTYEATVASRNQFGLNSHGDLFTFLTKAEDPLPVTEPEQITEDITEIIVEQPTDDNTTKIQNTDVTSSSMKLKLFINLCIFCMFLHK